VKRLDVDLVPLSRADLPYESLMAILFAEAAAAFEALTLTNRDDQLTWQDADAWPNEFRKARFLSAVDHVQADRLRRLVMQEMDAAFSRVDLIIGPSLAGPMLTITNFTGHPSLCVPAGLVSSPSRTPVSLSRSSAPACAAAPPADVPYSICLYGRLFGEATLLAFGAALESALAFAVNRPNLSPR
jgi:Asp-tRNA(Asn)/Glu-tRNA(Gln) amidotransferase A subunit family amidase